jgi:hypothetical protein
MKKFLALSILFSSFLLFQPEPSEGCIAIPIRPDDSQVEMALPEQRAFLYRQGETEHMILSVQYNGATEEFAWVIPTENRAKVDVQPGAPFHELWKVTTLKPQQKPVGGAEATVVRAQPPGGVQVLERKIAGPYDIAVLKASDSGGLYKWLRDNGFGLNQNTRNALDDYIKKDWYFVAARIRPDGRGNAGSALKNGTIAPLHIAYKAKELSYPLRVTAGNPGTSEIELFVVTDSPPEHAGLNSSTFRLTPSGKTGFEIDGPANRMYTQGDFPTLRNLIPKGGTLTKYDGRMTTAQRQRDLVFDRVATLKKQGDWMVPDV